MVDGNISIGGGGGGGMVRDSKRGLHRFCNAQKGQHNLGVLIVSHTHSDATIRNRQVSPPEGALGLEQRVGLV